MASPASRAASTSTTQCTSVTVTRDSSSTPTDTTASVRAAESCLRLLKHLSNYFVKINENFYLEGSKKPYSKIFSHFTVTLFNLLFIVIEVATVLKSFVIIIMINPPNLHSTEPK